VTADRTTLDREAHVTVSAFPDVAEPRADAAASDQEGAEAVASRYSNDAKAFEANSDSHLEVLHMSASSGLAYWVGIQRARVQMHGKLDPMQFDLRVTELFRREGDDWKLIHRHADALKA